MNRTYRHSKQGEPGYSGTYLHIADVTPDDFGVVFIAVVRDAETTRHVPMVIRLPLVDFEHVQAEILSMSAWYQSEQHRSKWST